MSEKIKIRKWEKLTYYDPERVLLSFRELEQEIDFSGMPKKVVHLRTNKLKKHKEGREAALFCHGLGKTFLNTPVSYSMLEEEDYDFVTVFTANNTKNFVPVQLKELVPDDLGNLGNLYEELEKLKKYVTSEDLVVAFFINRTMSIDFSQIDIPDLNISELYFFGAASPDQSRWFICGGKLDQFQMKYYEYPKA